MAPINPYGQSKCMIETILAEQSRAKELHGIALRYFNASGADPLGRAGERHDPETHLIPLVIETALGKREDIKIFGTDYDTPDGTCIRDYVHVCDLVDAHVLGLKWLENGKGNRVFNLGTGSGFSVMEVIEQSGAVTNRTVPYTIGPRRAGDCTRLVSGSDRAEQELGWRPKRSTLETIVRDAWRWHQTGHYEK